MTKEGLFNAIVEYGALRAAAGNAVRRTDEQWRAADEAADKLDEIERGLQEFERRSQ